MTFHRLSPVCLSTLLLPAFDSVISTPKSNSSSERRRPLVSEKAFSRLPATTTRLPLLGSHLKTFLLRRCHVLLFILQEIASRLTFGEAKHCNNDKSPLHPFLLCVSDLLLLGRATIEESRSLLIHWLDTEEGFGKMGVCGRVVWVSHETNLSTTLPYLSPHSAVVAFILKHGSALEAPREELEAQKITMILDQVREREREDENYSLPHFTDERNPEAVMFVAATDDGYITMTSFAGR
ncbi:hypothetical protein HID58_053642 [Brassica napus]|uniref:Uncharacterized protein n=1 Tax=Brassica napus TaxID=3708 RepID=A0ABQ8AFH8_BRANA|nr:hypothetical protein HID58_053642 [Brassica napus]